MTFLPGTLDSQSEDDKEYVEASENNHCDFCHELGFGWDTNLT